MEKYAAQCHEVCIFYDTNISSFHSTNFFTVVCVNCSGKTYSLVEKVEVLQDVSVTDDKSGLRFPCGECSALISGYK